MRYIHGTGARCQSRAREAGREKFLERMERLVPWKELEGEDALGSMIR